MLAGCPAAAADLAGEWRAACGAEASETSVVLEYTFTGGTAAVDNGMEEDSGTFAIAVLEKQGRLSLKNGAVTWEGKAFTRCRKPADRSAIRLDKNQILTLSSAIFVDARAKSGCRARDYQYLRIDLIGPLGFALGRWNSVHLAETLAAGGKSPVTIDEVSNWTIEKADITQAGVKLTVTELIPPNGSRGDTTTVTLATADGKLSIPEWRRTYLRCPNGVGAAH
jgi:hypothetical protein